MSFLDRALCESFTTIKTLFHLFLENTLAQLTIARNTNIELIKKYEEKKLEEHR